MKDWTREELEKDYVGVMKVVTIPINKKFEGKTRIIDLGELREILDQAELLAQSECDCRKKMGNCIEPMDGCISIDDKARRTIEKGDGHEVSVDEVMAAFRRTADAGLVHLAYDTKSNGKVDIICSCCACCCHSLSAVVRFGYSDHILSSKNISMDDPDKCEACGVCVDACHFRARELKDGKLEVDYEKCAGCGICAIKCPSDAIEMVAR